jgi:hypothetical protein
MEHDGANMDLSKLRKMLRDSKRKRRLKTGKGHLPD